MSTYSFHRCALALFALQGCALGCSESIGPELTGGIVFGTVTSAQDAPVVGAEMTLRSVDLDAFAHAVTDTSGAYQMEVPPGEYKLRLNMSGSAFRVSAYYSTQGLTSDRRAAETLYVALSPRGTALEANMSLGAVRVVMNVPPELEGERIKIDINGWGGESHWEPSGIASDGRVVLIAPALRPDSYSASGYLPNGEPIEYSGNRFVVWPGEPKELTWDIPEPGWVRGRLTGSWQEFGLDPPTVTLVNEEERTVSRARTDPDGSFELPLFNPTHVLLRTAVGGFRFERFYDETGRLGGRPFLLRSGAVFSGIHIREFGLAGSVVGPDGFRPARGHVDLFHEDDDDLLDAHPLRSPHAAFEFSGLLPGTYYLRARTPSTGTVPWAGQWYDGAETRAEATPIIVDGSSTVTEVQVTVPWDESVAVGGAYSGEARGTGRPD